MNPVLCAFRPETSVVWITSGDINLTTDTMDFSETGRRV